MDIIERMMNEAAHALALLVVASHLGVIFWPRRPLKGPIDQNGLPIVWCNHSEEHRDVTCVWTDAGGLAPALSARIQQVPPKTA